MYTQIRLSYLPFHHYSTTWDDFHFPPHPRGPEKLSRSRPPDKSYLSYFSTKTYVMGAQKNCLDEFKHYSFFFPKVFIKFSSYSITRPFICLLNIGCFRSGIGFLTNGLLEWGCRYGGLSGWTFSRFCRRQSGLVEVCSGIKGGGIWGGYYVGICPVGCVLGRGLWLRVTLKVG